ncbi:L-threonine ammonia-lyase [Daktulosphaira vitifoliae]|uniref:L-threonine ammonia-lyase n=1 Tax=Daktulosphaira vitifoliae TaxID=58002 RepID=UPI0021AAE42C|nr:L-threonine ammonia-lyase [Daktulosphaira vitifoliae]
MVTEHDHLSEKDNNDNIEDPACLESKPVKISFEDITSAAYKIKNGIVKSSCAKSHLSKLVNMELYLKKDFVQVTGSFKERGACYALMMLSEEDKRKGVISASLGNHAQALSYHGKRLNIPVTVVMPTAAPIMKIEACRNFGANVIVQGLNMKESKQIALKMSNEKNIIYINGYDHPNIMAGQGTVGLEILEDVPDADAIVVPVGGGGLLAGVSLAVKTLNKNCQIIGVESDRFPSFSKALEHGKPVPIEGKSTLADGLAVPMVGYNAFVTAAPLVDKMIVVTEEWISIAILRLVESEKCVVEGAGAIGLAAALSGQMEELAGKKVVLLLCGGNIDTSILGRCLDRGLAIDGRLVKFHATLSDRPGGIAELCRILATIGVCVKDIIHERAWLSDDVFSVRVKVVCETRDLKHAHLLQEVIKKNYTSSIFGEIPLPKVL